MGLWKGDKTLFIPEGGDSGNGGIKQSNCGTEGGNRGKRQNKDKARQQDCQPRVSSGE